MKCERCGKELSGLDLYCERCGKAVFPEYMDEADIWAYYKTDEELAEILKAEEGQETKAPKKSLWEAALLKEQETEAESLEAKKLGCTRATASMDKAAAMGKPLIFAIGNAPTALVRLYELIQEKKISPYLIIGVPVGFVNVVQSKEMIMETQVPYIVARGRKGGSNIAACICNALLYMIDNERDYWK